jgi:hypothetical protein
VSFRTDKRLSWHYYLKAVKSSGAAEVRQSKEDTAIGDLEIKPKMTEEQKRALEEAVKRAIEDWLKNRSTPRKLRGG